MRQLDLSLKAKPPIADDNPCTAMELCKYAAKYHRQGPNSGKHTGHYTWSHGPLSLSQIYAPPVTSSVCIGDQRLCNDVGSPQRDLLCCTATSLTREGHMSRQGRQAFGDDLVHTSLDALIGYRKCHPMPLFTGAVRGAYLARDEGCIGGSQYQHGPCCFIWGAYALERDQHLRCSCCHSFASRNAELDLQDVA